MHASTLLYSGDDDLKADNLGNDDRGDLENVGENLEPHADYGL